MLLNAGSGFDEDEVEVVVIDDDVVLGALEGGKDVGRGGEGANAVGESDHLGAIAVDLDQVAELVRVELVGVDAVDDDCVGLLELLGISGYEVERTAEGRVGIASDDGDGLSAAAGLLPDRPADDVFNGLSDAGSGEDLVVLALVEGDGLFEVGRIFSRNPDVGAGVIDDAGGAGGEALKKAPLHYHENHAEGDAGERDDESDAIVEEIAAGKRRHQQASFGREGKRGSVDARLASVMGPEEKRPKVMASSMASVRISMGCQSVHSLSQPMAISREMTP